jgi:hypothetical protein
MFHKGRPLTPFERAICHPYFRAETLTQARIVEGYVPFWLRRCMCAVVLGRRIFMRKGAYLAGPEPTLADVKLLAHELTHVEQYLSGMTVMKYLWASRHGYRQNAFEIEAYAKGDFVASQIADKHLEATQFA